VSTEAAFAAGIDALIAEIAGGAWFAACGTPLGAGERDDAARYAAALGFDAAPVTQAADWRQAAAVAQSAEWSRLWWEREAAEEAAVKARAAASLDAVCQLEGLSRVALAAATLAGAAAMALARAGVADEALARVAAGAAAQACHQAALARAAGASDAHVFVVKFRLFASGRFPLGVVGGQFFVL
jgi:hypothetical protein